MTSRHATGRRSAGLPLPARGAGWLSALVVAVLVAAGPAGCGLPEDAEPRAIDQSELPEQLVNQPTTTVPDSSVGQPTVIYLVDDENGVLDPVFTQVEVPVGVARAVSALLATESVQGLTNFTNTEGLRLLDARESAYEGTDGTTGGLVTLVLTPELANIQGEAQRKAVAQMVFTATGFAGVDFVAFEVDGEPRPVSADLGGGTRDVVNRANYEDLRPTNEFDPDADEDASGG